MPCLNPIFSNPDVVHSVLFTVAQADAFNSLSPSASPVLCLLAAIGHQFHQLEINLGLIHIHPHQFYLNLVSDSEGPAGIYAAQGVVAVIELIIVIGDAGDVHQSLDAVVQSHENAEGIDRRHPGGKPFAQELVHILRFLDINQVALRFFRFDLLESGMLPVKTHFACQRGPPAFVHAAFQDMAQHPVHNQIRIAPDGAGEMTVERDARPKCPRGWGR